MAESWRNQVDHVRDGEPVSSGVVGRPARALEGNLNYIRDLQEIALAGQSVVAAAAEIDPALVPGQPVYFDSSLNRFAPALAAVTVEVGTGALIPTPSSDCLGILVSKSSATVGRILLAGRALVDLTAAIGSTPVAGRYYLSSAVAGRLVRQRPAVSVPVLQLASDGYVYVQPQIREFLSDHVHFALQLKCAPAGTVTPPAPGARHTLTSPNVALQGWLPAGHASFAGAAPLGASWGYNIAAHPELSQIWPPLPVTAAMLVFDRGETKIGGTIVPLGTAHLAVIDSSGIWWMSDAYGDVPWPTAYNSASPPTPLAPNTSVPEAPRLEEMRMTLAFAKSLYADAGNVVTRITPADGSPITVTDTDGDSASTGSVQLGLDLSLSVGSALNTGSSVLKTLAGQAFARGHVVEGIRVDSTMTMTSSVSGVDGAAAAIGQGTVVLGVQTTPVDRELAPHVTRLQDVRERDYLGLPYLAFPPDRSSSVEYVIHIPPAGLPVSPTVVLRFALFMRSAGNVPAVTVEYRRLPRPSSGAIALVTADTALTVTGLGGAATSATCRELTTQSFAVAAGDTLVVTVTRPGGGGYSDDLGVYRAGAVLGA